MIVFQLRVPAKVPEWMSLTVPKRIVYGLISIPIVWFLFLPFLQLAAAVSL